MGTATELDSIITDVSSAIRRNACVYFLGSGISKPSGGPNWSELLAPRAAKLGLTLSPSDTDLPSVAQYIVNADAGNRGPLLQHVKQALEHVTVPNDYHRSIARTSLQSIWTTNFDTLLERSLGCSTVSVKSTDSHMTAYTDTQGVELIKVHGCASASLNDLVITQQDFEDFAFNRPAMAQRLRMDLLSKKVLFLGYSYSDPDIMNAVAEARRLSKSHTLHHYLVTTADGSVRQGLWAESLRRFGIECVLVPSYKDVGRLLREVSLKSRGSSVYITGSHSGVYDKADDLGIGLSQLRPDTIVVHDGQSTGISRGIIAAYTKECVNARQDLRRRIEFFPNPYSANPDLANACVIG